MASVSDAVAALSSLAGLPEVADDIARVRGPCPRLRWHQALRRRATEAAAESRIRGAWASAELDGARSSVAIVRDLMAGYRARVARELSAARDVGEIASGTDVDAATVMFLAMVQGLVMQALAVEIFTAMPALASRLFGLFRHSLGYVP